MSRDFKPLVEAGLLPSPGTFGNHDASYTAAVRLAYILGQQNPEPIPQGRIEHLKDDLDVSVGASVADGQSLDEYLAQALPLVTIIHGEMLTSPGKVVDAFGIPQGCTVHALEDHPGDNHPEQEQHLVETLRGTDYLLLQADLVEMGVHSLAGAAALVVQEGFDGISYVGYFDAEYQKVPEPWWTTRS